MTVSFGDGCIGGGGLARFAAHAIRGRWFMVFASFLIMSMAGATYLFGVYSKEIKKTLGYSQQTLNLLGFFKDFGANIGVLSGLIGEVTPPWLVLLIGAAMNFAGYLMIWLSVTERIAKPKVWQMCLYICVGANSQNFANTGSLVPCVKNFPESRGIMVGLLKGFVGLSGAIMTQFYHAVYGDHDSKNLILLIGWLPAAVSIFFVYTIRTMKVVREPNEKKIFYRFLYISILLAVFLMAVTIAQKEIQFSHAAYSVTLTFVFVILFLPLGVALKEECAIWKLRQTPTDPPNKIIVQNPPTVDSKPSSLPPVETTKPNADTPKKSWLTSIIHKPDRGDDYTIMQALLSVDMLILFLATFCGLGSSLTAMDNLGQIGESLGYPTHTVSTFTSLVSIWNYSGRVFAGFVSEALLAKGIPRTLMMSFVLVLGCFGHLIIAFPFSGSIYIASILMGFSYGAQLTLLFTIISELFGLKYYATLFNCGQLASPFGSYVLNVKVAGVLYDNEGLKQLSSKGLTHQPGQEITCLGKQCFRLSFIVLSVVTAFGALVSFILVLRTGEFYKSDIYKKFKEEGKEERAIALSRSNSA